MVLESLIDEHKKEKAELSKVNEELKEQNTGMSHTISDLHNTIDALQNEKASLLTIIRLLQSESTVNNNANYSHSAYQKFRRVNLSIATARQLTRDPRIV